MQQAEENIGEVYVALDNLLKAVCKLPMGYIMDRPPLHKAFDRDTEVIDQAVKEGHYAVQRD